MSNERASRSWMRFVSRTNAQMSSGGDTDSAIRSSRRQGTPADSHLQPEERTVSTNHPDPLEFAAFVGIDWADRQHVWALRQAGSSTIESGQLDHTPQAVDQWAVKLAQRFAGRPIAVALEQSRGPLVFMLSKYAHLVLFPVHPAAAANYRRSFR